MAKIPKLIKAALDFGKMLPEQLHSLGQAIWTALTGNVNFPAPPVDLNVFKAKLDSYATSIGDSRDGGKKAITLRNRLGEEVIRMIRAIALYVELNCKDDMNIFLSSGLTPRSSARTPVGELNQPMISSVDYGPPGELLVWIKSVGRKAKNYDVHYGVIGAGGALPTTWSTVTVPNTKTPARLTGLTPGTTYAIQVRAYGPAGYTPYSDSAVRMAT
jgi:hypothetical protein